MCRDCDKQGFWVSPLDEETLCQECALREIGGLLRDCDPNGLKILRRRIEDHLRKNPATLYRIAAHLILWEVGIRWIDLV